MMPRDGNGKYTVRLWLATLSAIIGILLGLISGFTVLSSRFASKTEVLALHDEIEKISIVVSRNADKLALACENQRAVSVKLEVLEKRVDRLDDRRFGP